MSIDAIIVMVMSMFALWGVATTALVYSMRKEDYKLKLIQKQRGFEPFCPAAQNDIETWLEHNCNNEHADEMRELLAMQQQALQKYPEHFYDWLDHKKANVG